MKLARVTITGADDQVPTGALIDLHKEFGFVEWGILLSQSREGLPRYPSSDWIMKLLFNRSVNGLRNQMPLAGHLCGSWAKGAVNGPFLWALGRHHQFAQLERVQVNGRLRFDELRTLESIAIVTAKNFIVQAPEMSWIYGQAPKQLHYLIDASGGTGKALECFEPPPPGFLVGYAGGIGPENVEGVLERLSALPGDWPYWIDVESGARDEHDRFSVEKVRAILEVARRFIA